MPPQLPSSPDPKASGHSPIDEALANYLTAGYGRVLELEAERSATSRKIDALLASRADDEAVLELVRRQRALNAAIAGMRAQLVEAGATRRPAREA